MGRLRRAVKWTGGTLAFVAVAAFVVAYFSSGNASCRRPGPASATGMQAAVYCSYGSPDVLEVMRLPKPEPADNEVLVHVRAASINPLDWHFMEGKPYIIRALNGLRRPNDIRVGVDYAGTVESVGRNVVHFKAGDEVFGGSDGALAEYVVVRDGGSIIAKPSSISFEQAAAVPVAAITALQGLRDHGRLRAGQKVLINGASGGVGTFAVQLARSFHAEVTGVASTRNVELLRSLGADHVIDYSRDDYTRGSERYDLIFDCVGNHSLSDNRRVLTAEGSYVSIGGGGPEDGGWLGPLARPLQEAVMSPFIKQHVGSFQADITPADLAVLQALLQSGALIPVVDRRYELGEAAAAMRYLEAGHTHGKVIVMIAP